MLPNSSERVSVSAVARAGSGRRGSTWSTCQARTAYSAEELVARNFIIHDKPDVVVDILDASNLERNLYLAVQIMELGVPLVLALNMSDVAKQRGLEFDLPLLEKLLAARIVPTVGQKGTGKEDLLAAAVEVARNSRPLAPIASWACRSSWE